MLNTDIDPLGDDTATNPLVDDHTKSVRGDVEYSASPSVVGLVWHTLLDSTIAPDVNEVSDSVDLQVG